MHIYYGMTVTYPDYLSTNVWAALSGWVRSDMIGQFVQPYIAKRLHFSDVLRAFDYLHHWTFITDEGSSLMKAHWLTDGGSRRPPKRLKLVNLLAWTNLWIFWCEQTSIMSNVLLFCAHVDWVHVLKWTSCVSVCVPRVVQVCAYMSQEGSYAYPLTHII